MKQVLENFKTGTIVVEDVPPPTLKPGCVLVRNHYSLISSGTEGSTLKLGQMGLIGKARARPEQARKVLQVARTEGVMTAYQAARRSLDMPVVLGYSCAGEVVDVHPDVDNIQPGDWVAGGGPGYANHAEIVTIPRNLCAKVSKDIDLRHGAFTTVGTIALQAVRIADVRIGENVVVIGLGLVGLLTVQLLRSAGCKVFGIDINPDRVRFITDQNYGESAVSGADNLHEQILAFTRGIGADAVVITAGTEDNGPVALAGELARHKGRVVVVGRTKMEAPRETYLFKELELVTSLAYGPGTGDISYEQAGLDYPVAYVRWTENRNMGAFLDLISQGRIQLDPLITHEFPVADAVTAFDVITGKSTEQFIAVLLRYPQPESAKIDKRPVSLDSKRGGRKVGSATKSVGIGIIGAGSFATNEFIPLFSKLNNIDLRGIATATGVRAQALGKQYGFSFCTSESQDVLDDDGTDCVFILTRHDTHASLATAALNAGKHVYIEKPLALTLEELEQVKTAHEGTGLCLMVGFNRRYAPLSLRLAEFFRGRAQPMSILFRANVGYRPPDHWLHDPKQGGGVIIGEACHLIDYCHWLVGHPVTNISTVALGGSDVGVISEDNVHITLSFADGSIATVAYLSNGSKAYSRERVEVYCDNKTAVLTDFRTLELAQGMRVKRSRLWFSRDKGHPGQIAHFLEAVAGKDTQTIDTDGYFASSLSTIRAAMAVHSPNKES